MNVFYDVDLRLLVAICTVLISQVPSVQGNFLFEWVTCGSVIKLLNSNFQVRLHSHEVKYGSGSGQQSVTGVDSMDDVNSHWLIRGIVGGDCTRGEPVRCGANLRLQHMTSGRNLHSHLFSSPLSGSQEVSAFGEGGEGDTGDHWALICDGDNWRRGEDIMLKHLDTAKYLSVSGQTYNRPIHGQLEVCAVGNPSHNTYWKTSEGIYIKPTDVNFNKQEHDPSEL